MKAKYKIKDKRIFIEILKWRLIMLKIIKSLVMYQVFEDGLDPDSLFDRLKEETGAEKKSVVKTPKPRKVSSESIFHFSAAIIKNVF